MINIPQKKELEDLINNEMTRAQIANIYKCSPSTVSLWFKKYNLKSKRIGRANNVKDLIGNIYGYLTVVELFSKSSKKLATGLSPNSKVPFLALVAIL